MIEFFSFKSLLKYGQLSFLQRARDFRYYRARTDSINDQCCGAQYVIWPYWCSWTLFKNLMQSSTSRPAARRKQQFHLMKITSSGKTAAYDWIPGLPSNFEFYSIYKEKQYIFSFRQIFNRYNDSLNCSGYKLELKYNTLNLTYCPWRMSPSMTDGKIRTQLVSWPQTSETWCIQKRNQTTCWRT